MNIFNSLIIAIKRFFTNYRNDKYFHDYRYDSGRFHVRIPDDKINELYGAQIYEDISRSGPGLVREIHKNVSTWCEKSKGKVDIPYAYNIETSVPVFYFSRAEVANEFRAKFLKEV